MKPCPVGITALTSGPDILIPLLWERGASHSSSKQSYAVGTILTL